MTREELQEVKVLVPVERVGQIYEMVAHWLGGPAEGKAAAGEDAAGEPYTPWSEDDLVLAKEVWNNLSPLGHELFSILMDHPEQRVSSAKLTEDLGAQVHGVEGWPARHCYDVGRLPAINKEWEPEGESLNYWMASNVAALFREARDGK